jgi:hypothetical protein
MLSKLLGLLLTVLLLNSCTGYPNSGNPSRDGYELLRKNFLEQCRRLVGREREECNARYQQSYDDYQRQRGEVID